jgi:hypothetical protein
MVLLILVALCGFSACESGAKKLERKPKTHVRKKKKEGKGLVTVFETPAPSAVYSLLSRDLKKLKGNTSNIEDTIADPAFMLGVLIAELSMAGEKNDQYAIYKSLQKIHKVFGRLKITDQSLDSLMSQSEKIVVKKMDLQQKATSLYPKVKELFTISGRKGDLAAVKVGVFVHQMEFILSNQKKIGKERLAEVIEFQKATAQNLLSDLVDADQNGRIEIFKSSLEQILSVFDNMKFTAQSELIYKDENGVYIISGGREYQMDERLLDELYEVIKNVNYSTSGNEK